MGVSGFLISCARDWAISRHAASRSSRESSSFWAASLRIIRLNAVCSSPTSPRSVRATSVSVLPSDVLALSASASRGRARRPASTLPVTIARIASAAYARMKRQKETALHAAAFRLQHVQKSAPFGDAFGARDEFRRQGRGMQTAGSVTRRHADGQKRAGAFGYSRFVVKTRGPCANVRRQVFGTGSPTLHDRIPSPAPRSGSSIRESRAAFSRASASRVSSIPASSASTRAGSVWSRALRSSSFAVRIESGTAGSSVRTRRKRHDLMANP